jgi:translocation and assembly module TamB
VQPGFGWGGDLAVVGHLRLHSAPTFAADVVLERQRGDLTVTDETGNTSWGCPTCGSGWTCRTACGTSPGQPATLGVAAGAFVAHHAATTWPTPDAGAGGARVQVANLGTWGPWLPPGWRLTGALRTSAGIGGHFGAPEYTGGCAAAASACATCSA